MEKVWPRTFQHFLRMLMVRRMRVILGLYTLRMSFLATPIFVSQTRGTLVN